MQYMNPLSLQNLTVEKFETTLRKAFDGSIKFVSIFQQGIDFFNFCRRCIVSNESEIFKSKDAIRAIQHSDLDILGCEGIDEALQLRNWRSFWD